MGRVGLRGVRLAVRVMASGVCGRRHVRARQRVRVRMCVPGEGQHEGQEPGQQETDDAVHASDSSTRGACASMAHRQGGILQCITERSAADSK